MTISSSFGNSSVSDEGPSIDIRKYLVLFRQWWWLILIAMALSGVAAYFISQQLTPIYESSTKLLVNEAANASSADYSNMLTNQMLARTYAQIITARPVMEKVLRLLNSDLPPDKLAEMVDVTQVRDTQLLVINVESDNPDFSAAIANGIAIVFAEQVQDSQRSRFAASEENLKSQMNDAENQISQLRLMLANTDDATEKDRLENRLNQYEQIYANLVVSYEQVRMTEAQSSSNVVQIESAIPNPKPVKPNIIINTLLAVIFGMVLAVGGILAYDAFDDTVRDPEEIQNKFNVPVMGTITRYEPPKDGNLITQAEPRSPVTESYRAIRTNIQYASVDKPLRTLLITSPAPGDGKTTVVSELAVVTAQSGKSVTVIDADLHRPRVHRVFNTNFTPGLSGLFIKPEIHMNGAFQSTTQAQLHIICSGELPPNPSELLGSQKMSRILEAVMEKSDQVFLDTPPVLSVTDAVVLAPQVDGVLLVVRPGITKKVALRTAIDQLRYVGANIIGIVINNVDGRFSRYSYYYSNYYKQYYHYPTTDKSSLREASVLKSKADKNNQAH